MAGDHELVGWDKAWGGMCETLSEVHDTYPEWLALTRYLVGVVAVNHPNKAKFTQAVETPRLAESPSEGEGVLFIPIYGRDYCLGVCHRLAKALAEKSPEANTHFIVPDGPMPKGICQDDSILWHEKKVLRGAVVAPTVWLNGLRSYFKATSALNANRKTRKAMTANFTRWKLHLAKTVGVYYWEVSCAKRWLNKHRIRAVVTINDVVKPAAPFVAAANQLGIPSIVIQHGAPGPQSAPFMAQTGWIWGDTSQELLREFGAEDHRLEMIGNLEIDCCKYGPNNSDQTKYELLLLSQWRASTGWGEPEFQKFFSNAADAAKASSHDWRLKIRLHPNEDELVKQQIIDLIVPFQVPYEFSDGDTPLEEDIAGCHFACTVSSSSIMHAVAASKPCALMISAKLEQRLGSPLLHKKQIARNATDLVELLNKIQPLDVEEREAVIANFGGANEKAADKLLAIMSD